VGQDRAQGEKIFLSSSKCKDRAAPMADISDRAAAASRGKVFANLNYYRDFGYGRPPAPVIVGA
jgi:hypothetical protein